MKTGPSLALFLALGCVLLVASTAHAQITTADLVGTVRDTTGGVVPGATVTLTNDATGTSRSAITADGGTYIFTALLPGNYTIAVEIPGFRKVERSGVELQVNQRAQIDIQLEVGNVSETVQIVGTAPLLETQSSVLGTVIDEQQVQDLPLNGRNFVQLATLAAGVSGAGTGMRGTIMSGTRPDDLRPGTELFVNGNRENSNNYLYDGIDNNTRLTLVIVMRPNVEAIKEFKVQTNLYSAEQGRNPGGQINVVTKSGSNAVHGTIYGFLRDDKFDANNFFANRGGQEKPPFRQTQFGGAIGGPISRNRTFFFADYDGFRQNVGRVFVNTVPTAKMRQGDFSEVGTIYDPLTTVVAANGTATRQPFASNVDSERALGPGHGEAHQRVPSAHFAWPGQQPGDHADADAGLESVRRAHRSRAERKEQLPRAIFALRNCHRESVHVCAGAAGWSVEGGGSRRRGHVRRSIRTAGGTRRFRLGARALTQRRAGHARGLQPLQPRFHAGRCCGQAISWASSSACRMRISNSARMGFRSSPRRDIPASATADRSQSSVTSAPFNTSRI